LRAQRLRSDFIAIKGQFQINSAILKLLRSCCKAAIATRFQRDKDVAIYEQLRSDCAAFRQHFKSITQRLGSVSIRLCSDCAVFAQQFKGDRKAISMRLRNDCARSNFIAIKGQFQINSAAFVQRLRSDSKVIAQLLQGDCNAISKR
jgi:hypothetical protein